MKSNWIFKPSSRKKWTFGDTSFSLELSSGWLQDKNANHSITLIINKGHRTERGNRD